MKKRILLFIFVISLFVLPFAHSQVRSVIGAGVSCPNSVAGCNPLPFTVATNLCTASCRLYTAPSYTDENYVYGNSGTGCSLSSNGGVTWANCTTSNPLASGGKEEIAGTADGAILMIGRGNATGGGTSSDCIAKRSTDHGVTFSSVIFVAVGEPCGGTVSGSTRLVCLSTGECVTTYADTLTSRARAYRSLDNGQTWASVLSTTTIVLDPRYLVYDGTVGFNPVAGSGFAMWRYSGAWALTANMPASLTSCFGAMIMGGEPYFTCIDSTATTQRKLLNSSLVVTATYTLPQSYTGAGQTGPIIYSPSPGIVYAAAGVNPPSGNVPIGIWVSSDSGSNWNLLHTGSQLANGSSGPGAIWKSPLNECLYVSMGTTPQFIRVCPG